MPSTTRGGADDLQHVVLFQQIVQNAVSDLGMLLDMLVFSLRERAGLAQQLVVDGDFAESSSRPAR